MPVFAERWHSFRKVLIERDHDHHRFEIQLKSKSIILWKHCFLRQKTFVM